MGGKKAHFVLVQKNTKDRVGHTILIFNNNNKEEKSINPVNLTF